MRPTRRRRRLVAAGRIGRVLEMAASPDGRRIALSTHDGRLLTCAVPAGEVSRAVAVKQIDSAIGDMSGLVFSPDSRWLAWSASGPGPWEDRGASAATADQDRRPQSRQGHRRDVAAVHRHGAGVHARREVPRVPVHPQPRPGLRHVLLRLVLPRRLPATPGCSHRRHPFSVRPDRRGPVTRATRARAGWPRKRSPKRAGRGR